MRSHSIKALATTLVASLLFASMAFLVKILSFSLSGAEILFARAVFSMVIIWLVVAFVYKRIKIRNINMLVVRGLFGGLSVLFYFIAISRIPLSSAVLLANSYPIFAVLFSAIIIKEKPNFDSVIVLLIALGGMFLVLEPNFGKIDIGYLLAIIAAVGGGVAVTSIRELRKTDSSWIIAQAQMIGAAFFSLFFLPSNFKMPSLTEWGLLLLIGVVGTAAQLAFTRPFKFIPTAEGTYVAPLYTVFAMLLAVLFLGEVLSSRFLAGAFLIFGGLAYLMVREQIKFRKSVL
ncbi:MAG: DMT family transporter [Candidatus Margulisbacteria bacterium]|nr:DMT family transporter [Candidatus Margulisiibacteriota bacterium]